MRANLTTSWATLAGGLTMGQWLSLPMLVGGLLLLMMAYRRAGKAQPTIMDG